MRTILAGSRDVTDYAKLLEAIKLSGFKITEVVSGCARGVDRLGIQYATEKNLPLIKVPAEWDKHGKSAGYRRNTEMAKSSQQLVVVWDGSSKGTEHMIFEAKKYGLNVYVHIVGPN